MIGNVKKGGKMLIGNKLQERVILKREKTIVDMGLGNLNEHDDDDDDFDPKFRGIINFWNIRLMVVNH